jgi:TolB protein
MQPAKAAFPGQNGKIAFSSNRSGNYEIYTVSSTGTEVDLNQRTFDPAPDQQPAYSPDGSRIAFRSNRSGNWDIWTIGSTGTEVSPLNITRDAAIDKEPAYSPDGSRIVFHSDFSGNMDIWTVDLARSDFDKITYNPAIDAEPAYSPDGNRIVFASNRSGNAEIYSVSSTGLEVGLDKITSNPALDEEPAYSPDGSKILFDSDRSGGINYDIYSVSSTGTEVGLNKITSNPALDYSADWQSLNDTTPPKVTSTVPVATATGVAPGANITATFSEAMDASTINGTTFKLFKAGTTTAILAVVTYDPNTNKAILNPNANLKLGTKYKAAVTTGAKDLAGNQLDQDQDPSNGLQQKGWSFTIKN